MDVIGLACMFGMVSVYGLGSVNKIPSYLQPFDPIGLKSRMTYPKIL